jgi:hypothetical protein
VCYCVSILGARYFSIRLLEYGTVKPCILMLRRKTGSTAIVRESEVLILAVQRSRNFSVGRILSELRFTHPFANLWKKEN